MRCVPEQKNARAVTRIIAALFAGSAVFYGIPIGARAAGIRVYAWIFNLLTFACLIGAIFLLVRYRMTGFQYIVRTKRETEDSGLAEAYAGGARLNVKNLPPETLDFVVIRSQGARPGAMECVLGLEQLIAVTPVCRKPKGKSAKNGVTKAALRDRYAKEGFIYYDYTLTFLWDEALALVFVDGNRTVGVVIEPDEVMRAYFTALKPEKKDG